MGLGGGGGGRGLGAGAAFAFLGLGGGGAGRCCIIWGRTAFFLDSAGSKSNSMSSIPSDMAAATRTTSKVDICIFFSKL